MRKGFKKIVAAAMVAAVSLTTNLGGLAGCIKVHAATNTVTIDEVQWELVSNGEGYSAKIVNTQYVKNKDIVVPSQIETYPITRLDAGSISNCTIKSLTIPKSIQTIGKNAIKSTSIEILNCESATINSNAIISSDIETINFNTKDDILRINKKALENCNAKKIHFDNSITKVIIDEAAFINCVELKNIVFDCDATLYSNAFANCTSLQNVEFLKDVNFEAYNSYAWGFEYYGTKYGIFYNCFDEEYGKNNILVNKTVKFKGNVSSCFVTGSASHMFSYCSIFSTCPGLTNVELSGKDVKLATPYLFNNCANLNNVTIDVANFELTFSEFKDCPMLKELTINCDNYCSSSTLSTYKDSSIETLYISAQEITGLNIDSSAIETLILDTKSISGNITNECTNLKKIIFPEEKYSIEKNSLTGFTTNLTAVAPWVYGYYHNDISYVATWVNNPEKKGALEFKDIIGVLKSSCQKTFYVENDAALLEDYTADINDFKTEAIFAYENNPENYFDVDSKDITYTFPKKLRIGKNPYTAKYSSQITYETINVEYIQPQELAVIWNDEFIDTLVSGDVVTTAQVVSSASIQCNNGDRKAVASSNLKLESNPVVIDGESTLTVSYTQNGKTVYASHICTVNTNYITSIKAEYNSKDTLYVGDKIDASKIKIIPTFKNDADKTVDRDISLTSLSNTVLSKEGANEITVYYNDLKTTMVVSATAIVPTKLYAMFDSSCKYYEGQSEIDPKTIAVTVEYNNGSKKTGADIDYTYQVDIKNKTNTTIQALVSYEGLETTIDIPVTPKEATDIKASANIVSATEGTKLSKTIIDKIEITYNNGKTETLDSTTIDYNALSFDDYVIVANQKSTIRVHYAGKTTEITIVGVSNTITSIYAEYIGTGQTVGTAVPLTDVAVHAVNANGQITDITDGILLENAIPYNVGANTVTIHYGSLLCTINVTGLPISSVTPVETEQPSATAPTQAPTPTNAPSETPTPTTTQPGNTTTITTPQQANNAPIVANSSLTITSSNAKITTATTDTYKVYTNKNITFTINTSSTSSAKYQIVAKGTKVSDTAWKDVVNNNITVTKTTKPSIVYIQYTDANGAVQTLHTNGFTIDKKKATVNVKKNKVYKKGQKVTFKDASGIKSAKLDGKKITSGSTVKKKGTHTLIVTDTAGNKTTVKFKIK